jgi:hypothetical protein
MAKLTKEQLHAQKKRRQDAGIAKKQSCPATARGYELILRRWKESVPQLNARKAD